jgi:hypothetical protein
MNYGDFKCDCPAAARYTSLQRIGRKRVKVEGWFCFGEALFNQKIAPSIMCEVAIKGKCPKQKKGQKENAA